MYKGNKGKLGEFISESIIGFGLADSRRNLHCMRRFQELGNLVEQAKKEFPRKIDAEGGVHYYVPDLVKWFEEYFGI